MKTGKSKGDIWRWNEEWRRQNYEAHKAMCRNNTEENKSRYNNMKNKAKKEILKTMQEKAEETLSELKIIQVECLG